MDVLHSNWDCTLEETHRKHPALRMGLRYVKRLEEKEGRHIEEARQKGPFASMSEFTARTGVKEKGLLALSTAGAFDGLRLTRRAAIWEMRGEKPIPKTALPMEEPEAAPAFKPLDNFQSIAWDRSSSSHSVRGHPLAPLRAELRRMGLPDARTLAQMRDGQHVHYAGRVINRQRPGTAKGVVFMTLEDETGFVNLVFWERVFQNHYVLARTASFLGVSGKLQSKDGVVHLVVQHLWEPEASRLPAPQQSRDFH